jgi:hypothetical protein
MSEANTIKTPVDRQLDRGGCKTDHVYMQYCRQQKEPSINMVIFFVFPRVDYDSQSFAGAFQN